MATLARPYDLGVNPGSRRNPGWWVMVLIITTEAMLFAYLLFGYYYLGSMAPGAFPPGGDPKLTLTLPNTIILLVSSGTMWYAERGIRAGKQDTLRWAMLATIILGMVFLVIQGVEYSKKTFTLQSNAYGGLFFVITGLHGTHVIVGTLINIVVLAWAWRGWFGADRHLAVTNAAMYWHFVDIVWLFVFFTLYITPRFGG